MFDRRCAFADCNPNTNTNDCQPDPNTNTDPNLDDGQPHPDTNRYDRRRSHDCGSGHDRLGNGLLHECHGEHRECRSDHVVGQGPGRQGQGVIAVVRGLLGRKQHHHRQGQGVECDRKGGATCDLGLLRRLVVRTSAIRKPPPCWGYSTAKGRSNPNTEGVCNKRMARMCNAWAGAQIAQVLCSDG